MPIASGLGDGFYQSYWEYDSNNEICELIVGTLGLSQSTHVFSYKSVTFLEILSI